MIPVNPSERPTIQTRDVIIILNALRVSRITLDENHVVVCCL